MIEKPPLIFDRTREWRALSDFVETPGPGARLGLVYGRRRQGKTFLLASLVEAAGGFMFGATQQSAAQNLRALSEAYCRRLGQPVSYFSDWPAAVDALLRLGSDQESGFPVVIDEFSYLTDSVAGMASIIQIALDPGQWAHRGGNARLILCGSALSTMRDLLGGSAPLRGRAQVNVMVHPFRYRDAAEFWGLSDRPELAFRVDALLGGTPAYKGMVGEVPESVEGFDDWACRRLLDPNEVIYAEGDVLLHQQPELVDPALYFAVLAAVSRGAHRRGEIAAALDRLPNAIGHALAVLEEVRFIERTDDALRAQRPVYSVAEPVIRWHQLVVAPNEAPLAIGAAERVWRAAAATVSSKIYGPHFEAMARAWTLEHADDEVLGGLPTSVRPATLACREHRQGHELDVVAMHSEPFAGDRILAIGEAKATTRPVGDGELERLRHLRDLLPADKVTDRVRLLLFSRSGFTRELRESASDVELIDLDRMYHG
ncbi:MAG: ATP-binding protein [Catenulispora sp.]|nr:ATP-binding protein [Catenulispora sp.]